jgi:hypothetical protein
MWGGDFPTQWRRLTMCQLTRGCIHLLQRMLQKPRTQRAQPRAALCNAIILGCELSKQTGMIVHTRRSSF